jgi:enediyne polyketide synthase
MSGQDRIAVVGLGCWYPGADSPRKLWENVLARRREFRRFPSVRLPATAYYHRDPAVSDHCYVDRAAVIDGFQFDWARRRIPRTAYESTDVVHWLALEVADQALLDAGYAGQPALRDRTGVVMGNSLTGEQSRAGTMRLRWPFVRRVLEAAAADAGLDGVARERLETCMEGRYKSVFAPVTEDTLAGGLSNTIAGRICNFFDFHGGGYTVDGACSSSLLAVCTAAEYLSRGTLDVVLAGGVDVSLDPFELVGFAKAGALAHTDMRVYDRGANGFLPGEGCGLVVLKRLADAERDGDSIYAVLRGWGISSDGKGGITAPSVAGQALALRRAYDRAGYSMASISFIEGHGTGTPVGDVTELRAAAAALRAERDAGPRRVGMTSLKSIIGHTKAAAGVGGFIKAVMAVNRRVLPPTAACTAPNPVFDAECSGLFPLTAGEIHPADEPMRAGVSAMGFGGINSHATLESGSPPSSRLAPSVPEVALLASSQSSELFLASAPSPGELQRELARLSLDAEELSLGDLADLASHLGKQVRPEHPVRFAAVASTPGALAGALRAASQALAAGQLETARNPGEARTSQAYWLGQATRPCRIGFLLPGQGSQQLGMGRTLLQRFDWAQELLQDADRWTRDGTGEPLSALIYRPLHRLPDAATLEDWKRALASAAQPAICFASLLQAEFLRRLGVLPVAVTGHSLGELTACCLAGAFDAEALLRLAALRGKAMSAEDGPRGRMASLGCDEERATALCERVPGYLVVANVNSPQQVAVAGDAASVEAAGQVAASQGISFRPLPVANAFHSKYVQRAAEVLLREAPVPDALAPSPVEIFSSTDGRLLTPGTPLRRHFSEQALQQVHFVKAVRAIASRCDVLVECGPGRVLTGLARDTLGQAGPVVGSVAARVDEQDDLHATLAQLFVSGANLHWELLHENRLVRPYRRPSERVFIENPLERPLGEGGASQPGQALEQRGGEVLALGARAGIAPAELQAYLETRGEFIAQVMAADVASRRSAGLLAVKPERASAAAPVSTGPAPTEAARPSLSVEERLVELVAARTGYRKESIALDARLLDDLNLDSIKAGDVVAGLAREFGAAGKVEAAKLANATLAEVARAVRAASGGGDAQAPAQPAPGSEAKPGAMRPAPSRWVRNFAVGLAERAPIEGPSFVAPRARVLLVHEAEDRELASALEQELARAQVAVEVRAFPELGLPPPDRATAVTLALLPLPAADGSTPAVRLRRGIQRLQRVVAYWAGAASAARGAFALVSRSDGGFGALGPPSPAPEQWAGLGLAQSLHLENPQDRIRVVDLAAELVPGRAAGFVLQELAGTETFRAAGYDGAGRRRTPEFQLQGPAAYPPRAVEWGPQDVVLVTGGAKGITARCVLELARSLPCRFALVGSTPREQLGGGEAGENLARLASLGVPLRYYACDLRDGDAVQGLFRRVEADLGPVTGVIHGAGTNVPRRLTQVSAEQAFDEVGPKLLGAMHLLAQVRERPVKTFAALSSIIGATGMPGNGWYAYSNEALDLMLRELSASRPELHAIGVAFGVWSEVGMGARLGSVERLERMGIGAIAPDEGARRFAQLFLRDPGCSRVVVTGPVGAALDTWHRPPPPAGVATHFVEQPSLLEPGVELRCRTRLTLERDPYLADHSFRDNLLLPTVFGLEAMAEAAAHTLGPEFPGVKGFESVSLERPIVVSPERGTEIELHVVVAEPDAQGRQTADVHIRTEQDDFQADCFSAVVVLGAREESPEAGPDLPPALDLEPGRDLYGGLLFQGPRFQRLVRVHRLSAQGALLVAGGKDAERTRRDCFGRIDRELLLGDPFVRDALLQALQLVAPDLVCLPVAIGRIERFAEAPGDGEQRIELRLVSRDERELVAEVRRFDAAGRLVERLTGYRASVLEAVPGRATPEQMLERARFDRDASSLASSRIEQELGIAAPALQLFWAPDLAGAGKEERRAGARQVALPAIRAHLGAETDLDWLPGGKPVLKPSGTEPSDVSLSHDGPYLVFALGRSAQGCDLQAITPRSRGAWIELLGERNTAALDDLARGGMSIDLAGTLLWAAREAGLKALQAEVIGIALSRKGGQSVLFDVRSASSSARVAATRLSLARGPDRVLAFCVEERPKLSTPARAPEAPAAPPAPAPEFVREGNRTVHRTRIPVSFREASTLSRRVHHTHFLAWLGKARELAMHECFAEMVPEFSSGRNGAVTNHASVSIHGELLAGDVVEIETYVSERTRSRVVVRFDFFRLLPEDRRDLVATGEMAATWVRILGPETVEPIAFPPYMESFLGKMSADPRGPVAPPAAVPAGSLSAIDRGRLLHSTDELDTPSDVLAEGEFPTSLVDANLVGNIYFANYFVWQSRVLDRFLHQAVPGLADGTGLEGELACTGTSMSFLREAMPFDDIRVKLRVRRLHEGGVELESAFFRGTAGGAETKIAVGKLGGIWLHRRDGRVVPVAMPEKLLEALRRGHHAAVPGLPPPSALPIAGARPAAARQPD